MSDEEHEKRLSLEVKMSLCLQEHTAKELAIGFLRYEALRRLTPLQFTALHKRNLNGENFDEMVDVMVMAKSLAAEMNALKDRLSKTP